MHIQQTFAMMELRTDREMISISITIKDVARELGVSYSSVSRALNGKEGVSKETRDRILEAADRMGYEPNDLARGLVNKVSKTIGVIIPDINNPFFGEIVTGITESANEWDYNIFLCISGWSLKNEAACFDMLRKKRVDGIILKSAGDTGDYYNVKTPTMIIERYKGRENRNIVEIDNELGGYLAVKHLMDCGYKDIGIITGKEDYFASSIRLSGARRALQEYGVPFKDDMVVEGRFTIEGGRLASEEMFRRKPSIEAIFGVNDVISLGILQYCDENNIDVPGDVGVIGFDNISYSRLPQIQLTTIHQPKQELGKMLFETLMEELRDGDLQKTKNVILNPEVIIRKTTRFK